MCFKQFIYFFSFLIFFFFLEKIIYKCACVCVYIGCFISINLHATGEGLGITAISGDDPVTGGGAVGSVP